MSKMKKFARERKWWIVAGIVLVVVIVLVAMRNGNEAEENVVVMRGDVISEVSITGQVKPARNIDLAFEKSGRISRVAVEVGQEVGRGSTLVVQENSELQAQLVQAEATLKQQQAKFDELTKGTRPEELAAKLAELEKAREDLEGYYSDVVNVANDAFAKADDAVRNKADAIFTNPDSSTPTPNFTITDSQAQVDVIAYRVLVRDELSVWRNELTVARGTLPREDLEALLLASERHISTVRIFLTKALDATNKATGVAVATLDAYKLNINTGLTNVNTAASSGSAKRQAIATQKFTVSKIQSEYDIKVTGATAEQLTAQEALVEQAEGQVQYYLSQIGKTILRAPFAGMVTKIVNREGEIVSANAPVVSVVGEGKYDIETYVAESDIAKVKTGNAARVTLDAYGSGVLFEAAVTQIDLSETLIEGVATFKTMLQFSEGDSRILPGLTANVDIMSERKENVLYVPTRNVITRNGKRFIAVIPAGEKAAEEVEVKIGIRGSDGRTELVSGLNEGDVLAPVQ